MSPGTLLPDRCELYVIVSLTVFNADTRGMNRRIHRCFFRRIDNKKGDNLPVSVDINFINTLGNTFRTQGLGRRHNWRMIITRLVVVVGSISFDEECKFQRDSDGLF